MSKRRERGSCGDRHPAGRDAASGGFVKYILVLVGIIGAITYIFVGGPKSVPGRAEASLDRRQEVWERISQLEGQRRDMLIMASLRGGSGILPPSRASRGGPWASGYREGFAQGYYVGSYLAESRRPNPLFFPISPQ